MFYYKVISSHWPGEFEFKSAIEMPVGQCFRIKSTSGYRTYPTRFKVMSVSDTASYMGHVVEIKEVDLTVEAF